MATIADVQRLFSRLGSEHGFVSALAEDCCGSCAGYRLAVENPGKPGVHANVQSVERAFGLELVSTEQVAEEYEEWDEDTGEHYMAIGYVDEETENFEAHENGGIILDAECLDYEMDKPLFLSYGHEDRDVLVEDVGNIIRMVAWREGFEVEWDGTGTDCIRLLP